MNKTILTWNQVFDLLEQIPYKGKTVYGVPKGGMILTAFLTNVRVTYRPELADIILDDLVDSGKTREFYKKKFPDAEFYALINKWRDSISDWIVFPWETDHPQREDNIQENIIRQLQYIGEDPNRPGLVGTPDRIVKMWNEVFRGYDSKKKPDITIFKNDSDGLVYDQMIIDSGEFYSHCEHHMVPFFGQYWFGYIPSKEGAIVGLSKVARLVDYHSARLQIQERLVHDIVEDIWNALSRDNTPPLGMGLVMEAEHLCKTMRGAKKKGKMTTVKLKGVFLDKKIVREEFLNRCK
jgi:GTP cyclohydrolase IA